MSKYKPPRASMSNLIASHMVFAPHMVHLLPVPNMEWAVYEL